MRGGYRKVFITMNKQAKYTKIYAQGKLVGNVKADGIFCKTIKENQYLKYPVKSIAFDVQSLKDAEQAGATWVHVRDTQTGVTYKTSLAHIWRAGFELDRGFGLQRALPLTAWIRQGKTLQLDLFPKGAGV